MTHLDHTLALTGTAVSPDEDGYRSIRFATRKVRAAELTEHVDIVVNCMRLYRVEAVDEWAYSWTRCDDGEQRLGVYLVDATDRHWVNWRRDQMVDVLDLEFTP